MIASMILQPENPTELWRSRREDTLVHYPELLEARAGEFAAASVSNGFQEDVERQQREAQKPKFVVEAENRLREYASGKRAGGGQQLADAAIVTGYNIYKAGIHFRTWAQGVVAIVGDEVRPFLRSTWGLLQDEAHGWKNKYTIADIPVADNLDSKSRNVETIFRQYLADNFDVAVARYSDEFGMTISTDNARELSIDYSRSKRSRSNFAAAVYQPSKWFANELYKIRVQETPRAGQESLVLFTAGGTGAGKSSSLSLLEEYSGIYDKSHIVVDSSLSNAEYAIRQINRALDAGKKVAIAAVYRDPVEAWVGGVLPRAKDTGRPVLLENHIRMHTAMRGALEGIIDYYEGNPNVEIGFINNSQGEGKAIRSENIDIFKGVEDIENLRERLITATKEAYENGDIGRYIYLGSIGRGRTGEDSPKTDRDTGRTYGGRIERVQAEENTGGDSARGGVRNQIERGSSQEPQPRLIDRLDQLILTSTPPTTQKPAFVVEAEERLRRSLTGGVTGSGTQQLADLAIVAGHHLYRVGMEFRDWLSGVVRALGDEIRPHLEATWQRLKFELAGVAAEQSREGTAFAGINVYPDMGIKTLSSLHSATDISQAERSGVQSTTQPVIAFTQTTRIGVVNQHRSRDGPQDLSASSSPAKYADLNNDQSFSFYKIEGAVMRVQRENLTELWRNTKGDILADHPELYEARAAELAAARVFNWFQQDWETLSSEIRDAFFSGNLDRNNERFQLFARSLEWTPMNDLRRLSGTRTLMRDLDHPIVIEKSTPPAEIIGINNYWRTERIQKPIETRADLREVWGDIGVEFRPRTTGEGAINTNHQGLHAIKTVLEMLDPTNTSNLGTGVSIELGIAQGAADYFRQNAESWGGKVGENFEMLADSLEEAIIDAQANDTRGIAIVDTTAPDSGRYTLRHEATHVWQWSINPYLPGLLSDDVIKADPDYPRLEQKFSTYYKDITPGDIVAETVAFIAEGNWRMIGFTDKDHALQFLDRHLTQVVLQYGREALNDLHLVHPAVKEVIEYVRDNPRWFGVEGAGKDFDRGPQGLAAGAGADGESARSGAALRSAQGRMAGGWSGEDEGSLRGDGQESGDIRSANQQITLNRPGIGPNIQFTALPQSTRIEAANQSVSRSSPPDLSVSSPSARLTNLTNDNEQQPQEVGQRERNDMTIQTIENEQISKPTIGYAVAIGSPGFIPTDLYRVMAETPDQARAIAKEFTGIDDDSVHTVQAVKDVKEQLNDKKHEFTWDDIARKAEQEGLQSHRYGTVGEAQLSVFMVDNIEGTFVAAQNGQQVRYLSALSLSQTLSAVQQIESKADNKLAPIEILNQLVDRNREHQQSYKAGLKSDIELNASLDVQSSTSPREEPNKSYGGDTEYSFVGGIRNPGLHYIRVAWSKEQDSYVAQVYEHDPQYWDSNLKAVVGKHHDAPHQEPIKTIEGLRAALKQYASLPPEVAERLEQNRLETAASRQLPQAVAQAVEDGAQLDKWVNVYREKEVTQAFTFENLPGTYLVNNDGDLYHTTGAVEGTSREVDVEVALLFNYNIKVAPVTEIATVRTIDRTQREVPEGQESTKNREIGTGIIDVKDVPSPAVMEAEIQRAGEAWRGYEMGTINDPIIALQNIANAESLNRAQEIARQALKPFSETTEIQRSPIPEDAPTDNIGQSQSKTAGVQELTQARELERAEVFQELSFSYD